MFPHNRSFQSGLAKETFFQIESLFLDTMTALLLHASHTKIIPWHLRLLKCDV